MPLNDTCPRWRCEILSPVDNKILWTVDAATSKKIVEAWREEAGEDNNYLTVQKLTRVSLNRSKNNLIKLYKIGSYANRLLYPNSSPNSSSGEE